MSQQTFKIYFKNATEKKNCENFCTWEKKKKLAIKAEQWERAKRRSQKMVQFLTKYPRSWFDFENFARCWLAEVICSAFSSSSLLRVVHFVVLVALILFFSAMHIAMMMMIKLLLQIFLFLNFYFIYFKSFTAIFIFAFFLFFCCILSSQWLILYSFHLSWDTCCSYVWWCWWWLPRRYLSM